VHILCVKVSLSVHFVSLVCTIVLRVFSVGGCVYLEINSKISISTAIRYVDLTAVVVCVLRV